MRMPIISNEGRKLMLYRRIQHLCLAKILHGFKKDLTLGLRPRLGIDFGCRKSVFSGYFSSGGAANESASMRVNSRFSSVNYAAPANGPNGTGCVLPIRQMSAAGKGENPRQINIAAQTATGAPMPNVLSRKPKTKMR
jgi:hypothetical protein